MDIKQVRSFLVVADTLNFTRAARQLHLSQPALSTQIKALEDHLGAALFMRNRSMVRLTPAGQGFLPDAQGLLDRIREIERRVASLAAGDLGELRLGFVASATLEIVPAIVLTFRKRYPRVSLELRNLQTVGQVEALRAGSLDAGFVRMPLPEKGFSVTRIHSEPFAIVLAKDHPLAQEKVLSVGHLARESFVCYGRRWAPDFFEAWTGICRNAGFMPEVIQETGDMHTALALVAAGLGVGIMPEGLTRNYSRVLRIKPLPTEKVRSEIGLAMASDRSSPLLRHLLLTAKDVVRSDARAK